MEKSTSRVKLKHPERFETKHEISKEKLITAAQKACDKLVLNYKSNGEGFPLTYSSNFKYKMEQDINWESGMYTGCYWLAYELTGEKIFKEIAQSHLPYYKKNIDEKINVHDHDVGFIYSPSMVAQYKVTGDEKAREIALDAAKFFYEHSYSKEGKFIIRLYRDWDDGSGCRTMMDSLLNAPFLFWAGKEINNKDYFDAAYQQSLTTKKYLIREDGSSYHHYQFDPKDASPVRGLTFQGYSDESCWGRGHSWGVYGFPVSYAYTGDETIRSLHTDVTNYFLNRLPGDNIPYWDYIFTEPSDQPKDSSCAVISACGLHQMAKMLDDAKEKQLYQNASAMLLESVIDNCTGDIGHEYDGLINRVTHALPQGQGIEECAVYGDYFYLEALVRYLKPDWEMYW